MFTVGADFRLMGTVNRMSDRGTGMAVTLAVLLTACGNSTPPASPASVMGSYAGTQFQAAGARADWNSSRSTLVVTISSYALNCSISTMTRPAGAVEVVIAVPTASVTPATFAIHGDPTMPNVVGMGVTQFNRGSDGTPMQNAFFVQNGTLRFDSTSRTQVAGSLDASDGPVSLRGAFTSPICNPGP